MRYHRSITRWPTREMQKLGRQQESRLMRFPPERNMYRFCRGPLQIRDIGSRPYIPETSPCEIDRRRTDRRIANTGVVVRREHRDRVWKRTSRPWMSSFVKFEVGNSVFNSGTAPSEREIVVGPEVIWG